MLKLSHAAIGFALAVSACAPASDNNIAETVPQASSSPTEDQPLLSETYPPASRAEAREQYIRELCDAAGGGVMLAVPVNGGEEARVVAFSYQWDEEDRACRVITRDVTDLRP
ncbi:MAG: hypothetical protein GC136_06050 [Alphaproteobacteria bacterium]|nr:hypothetical protein [Alphaproteobacteria bacterium]